MSNKTIISTNKAPKAIGPYSQAVKAGNTVYISGQIPLVPATMEMIEGDITAQTQQVFANLAAIAEAAGGCLDDATKVNISLTDLSDFAAVNEVMASVFQQPFPARACVQVAALPKAANVEIEVILAL
ncbi:Rid family detoxifying hydrolase [Oceanicoccus sp. KOV_DT_Chl]|uniref:Rid family detoxifying hydrolase n=1 Tax=Oceanicoccus sp. KOV_DT_Chl TaxID=1904639 RepID=UPI000C79B6EA|nr:Rid family detoxifying hydrolase [Oceanicoccus sp. KOV_DT_Chl]